MRVFVCMFVTMFGAFTAMAQTSPPPISEYGRPASYDRIDFDWLAQYFSSRGYLVFQPNFRGSSGHGDAFRLAGHGEWGAMMQDDVTTGVKQLIAGGYVNKDDVSIAGASYGGYAALAGGAFTPDLYKRVIAIAGVSDLERMLLDERRQSGRYSSAVSYWNDNILGDSGDKSLLKTRSPAKHADAFQAKVLLIHGNDDTVVPITQSVIMNKALKRAGKDVTYIKLKGEDHWLSSAEIRLATLDAIDAFLKE